jgi:hypothetical protein
VIVCGCRRLHSCRHSSYFDAFNCCVTGSSHLDAAAAVAVATISLPAPLSKLINSGRRTPSPQPAGLTLHMTNNPELFRAYLDESEEEISGIYAVGGFVGKANDWEQLEPKWLESLPSSISHFHATDCVTGNKEFEGTDIPVRAALLDRLADLLISYDLSLIGYGIDANTYRELAPKKLQNDFLGNKYAAPFGGVVELACVAMGNGPGPEGVWDILEKGENWEQCAFFIEDNEYRASAERTIASVRNSTELWWRHRIGSERYGAKVGASAIPLLQVGDLGAYLAAKVLGNAKEGKISWKKYFDKIKAAGRVYAIRWADKRSLELLYGTFEDVKNEKAAGKNPWDRI